MPHDRQPAGVCPKCSGGGITCSYNHFERNALSIDAWEHKCPNCGFRETKAFRSDDETASAQQADSKVCPYCGRRPADSH